MKETINYTEFLVALEGGINKAFHFQAAFNAIGKEFSQGKF